jgi:hypothetical protein
MTITEPAHHDHGPHSSDDPTYTETWYWQSIDTESRTVYWIHCTWLPAQGRGQHTIALITPEGTRRQRYDTTEVFKSPGATIEIVEPWKKVHLTSALFDVDLQWEAFHPVIDFGTLLHFNETASLDHYEGGGRGRGIVGGRSHRGGGFRDRSFGPRNMRTMGKGWAFCAVGLDEDIFLAYNAMWTMDHPINSSPDRLLGCLWRNGETSIYTEQVMVARELDAHPMRLVFPDGIEILPDFGSKIGETWFIFDPNSRPATDGTFEPCYQLRDQYLQAGSPQLGRLVGFWEEGALWTN